MPSIFPHAASPLAAMLLSAEPWRAAMEFVSFQFKDFRPAIAGSGHDGQVGKPGDGHPVIIFPGLGGDGSAVEPLRTHCASLGYKAIDWGLGHNTGPKGELDTWMARWRCIWTRF